MSRPALLAGITLLAGGLAAEARADVGFAGAESAALATTPGGLPVEIDRLQLGGTWVYDVDLLLPGSRLREVILRGADGLVLDTETDTLAGAEAAFYADVAALVDAGGTIGLPAGGQAAADANPGWDLRVVEYDVEAGTLIIESALRQATQVRFFEVLAADGAPVDPPPPGEPGEPVDAAGAIAVAEALLPDRTAIEVEAATDDGQGVFEVEMLDPAGPSVTEVVVLAGTGQVLETEPVSLSPGDIAELQALGGLLPLPLTLAEAADLVLAETGGSEVLLAEFEVEAGQLFVRGSALVGGAPVNVLLPVDGGGGEPGGDPVDAAGAIAIAEGLFPDLVSIEIDRSSDAGQATFEVELLDPAGPTVTEVEIVTATGRVIGTDLLSLSAGELAEAQALAGLLPLPVSLTEAVDLVLAETGPGEILIVEFEVAAGRPRIHGTVLVGGNPVGTVIDLGGPIECTGDLNGDLDVDFEDVMVVLTQFGLSVEPGTGADLDGSGSVDFGDILAVLAAFSTGC